MLTILQIRGNNPSKANSVFSAREKNYFKIQNYTIIGFRDSDTFDHSHIGYSSALRNPANSTIWKTMFLPLFNKNLDFQQIIEDLHIQSAPPLCKREA